MKRRHFILTIPAILFGLTATPVLAAGEPAQSDAESVLPYLLKIIDKAGTIIPGVGFKSIKLGDPLAKLVQRWGPPKSTGPKGALNYLLDANTLIHFLGDKRIETIVVRGNPGSFARVNNGIRFGMTPDLVIAQYNIRPDKHNKEMIRYRKLGIEYWFKAGILAEIKVYRP